MAGKFLQPTQTEAHVTRLTNIKTQLQSYKDTDGRAAEALPSIDAAIASLSAEPFEPTVDIVDSEADEAAAAVDDDGSRNTDDAVAHGL